MLTAALEDIQRKRSRFLEDALAAVLRHVWRFVETANEEEDNDGGAIAGGDDGDHGHLTALQATELCLGFAEPLLLSVVEMQMGVEGQPSDIQELTREVRFTISYWYTCVYYTNACYGVFLV